MAGSLDALLAELRADDRRRAELRQLLLGDAPDLQAALADLARAGERTEARLETLTQRVDALAAAQERTEARLESLTERVDGLASHLEALTEQVRLLASRMDDIIVRTDRAHGYLVERRYADKGHAYFQRIARRLRPLAPPELDELLDQAGVPEDDAAQVRYADAVFAGRLRADDSEAYLVVETSVTIGHEDVSRAHERAEILRRSGIQAVPVVAGEQITPGAASAARFLGVWQVTDGSVVPPDGTGPVAGAA